MFRQAILIFPFDMFGSCQEQSWHGVSDFGNFFLVMQADNTAICLFSIWFSNRRCGGSICPRSCLDLLSCRISNQQGSICSDLFAI